MNKNIKIIYLIGFLFAMPIALTSYVNSSFLTEYISEYYIGFVYAFSSIITILCMLGMPKMLTRIGNRKTSVLFIALCAISLLTLGFSKSILFVLPAFVVFFVTSHLLIATLDIFVENFSGNSSIGKFRGLYLTFVNLSWVVAQTISGTIIARSSFSGIYLFGAFFMLLVLIIFNIKLRRFKDPVYEKVSIMNTLRFFKKNKNISKIYLANFILKFFFVWMIIYTPIYLHEYMGFGWDKIGLIFTIMLTPFVLLTYPLGKLSDKIGEKRMLLAGFAISAVFTMLIPLITDSKLWIWAGILFMTRVGASAVEIMSESYFFKNVSDRNIDAISFFRNTTPMSFIFAPLIAIPILLFMPSFEYIFFILSAILLSGLYIVLRIKDIK